MQKNVTRLCPAIMAMCAVYDGHFISSFYYYFLFYDTENSLISSVCLSECQKVGRNKFYSLTVWRAGSDRTIARVEPSTTIVLRLRKPMYLTRHQHAVNIFNFLYNIV